MVLSITSSSGPLYISDSVLYDFVTAPFGNSDHIIHVKDSTTGIYLTCNQAITKVFGLKRFEKPKNLIGLSIHDIDRCMHPYWGEYAKKVAKMDYQVKDLSKTFTEKESIFLNGLNQVFIQDLFKLPLVGKNNKVNAILTIATDRTRSVDLLYLLNLYMTMHKTSNIGLDNFIQFLGLNNFFHKNLTYKEVLCLLYMRFSSTYKGIAKDLHISTKTIETHVAHLNDKLKHAVQLIDVVNYLRKNSIDGSTNIHK